MTGLYYKFDTTTVAVVVHATKSTQIVQFVRQICLWALKQIFSLNDNINVVNDFISLRLVNICYSETYVIKTKCEISAVPLC